MNKVNVNTAIALFLSMLIFSACNNEDAGDLDQSDVFIKYYGSDRGEVFVDMIRTSGDNPGTSEINEGGIILLGSTTNTDLGDRDILLVGTDYAGNRIWQQQYGFIDENEEGDPDDDTGSDDVPSSIRISSDSTSIFIVGTAGFDTETESLFFIEASAETGEVISELRVKFDDQRNDVSDPNFDFNGEKRTRGADILELEDSYVLLGSIQSGTEGAGEVNRYAIFLANIDQETYSLEMSWSDLTVNWDEFDGSNSGDDFGVKLLTDDEDYYYLAASDDPNDESRTKVLINSFDIISGQPEADAPRFGIDGTNSVPTNFISVNQNLVVTGTAGENLTEKAFFLLVNRSLTNSNEEMILVNEPEDGETTGALDEFYREEFNDNGYELEGSKGSDLVRLNNGDYYIIGQFNNFTNGQGELKQDEIALIRVDDLGNVIPSGVRVYGSDGNDSGNAVLVDGDTEDLVVGATMDFGGVATMLSVIKTNVQGEFGE